MEFLSPATLDEALAARAAHPDAVPIMGGTDVMVELNFDRRRPDVLLDPTRVAELRAWEVVDGHVRLGAGVTLRARPPARPHGPTAVRAPLSDVIRFEGGPTAGGCVVRGLLDGSTFHGGS